METGNEHAALCILAKLTKMDDSLSYNILDADAVDPERVDKRMVELDSKPGKYRHVDHAVVDFMLIGLFHDFVLRRRVERENFLNGKITQAGGELQCRSRQNGAAAVVRRNSSAVGFRRRADVERLHNAAAGTRVRLHHVDRTRFEKPPEPIARIQPFSGGQRNIDFIPVGDDSE